VETPGKKRGLPGCLWKGPLGCLSFALGMSVVLSALLPFACGSVSERALEASFDRLHQGSLSIDDARIGAVLGRQGFWGVELPSLASLVSDDDDRSLVWLEVRRSALEERVDLDGLPTTNLQLALRRKARTYPTDEAPDAPVAPEPPPGRAATTEGSAASAAGSAPAARYRAGDASVRLGRRKEDALTVQGVEDLPLEGVVRALSWTDAELGLAFAGSELDLTGFARSEGDEVRIELALDGPLALGGSPEPVGRVLARVRFESVDGGELTWVPAAVGVRLEREGADGEAFEELARRIDRLLTLLGEERLHRADDGTTWSWPAPVAAPEGR